jgi:hypothetical protein
MYLNNDQKFTRKITDTYLDLRFTPEPPIDLFRRNRCGVRVRHWEGKRLGVINEIALLVLRPPPPLIPLIPLLILPLFLSLIFGVYAHARIPGDDPAVGFGARLEPPRRGSGVGGLSCGSYAMEREAPGKGKWKEGWR